MEDYSWYRTERTPTENYSFAVERLLRVKEIRREFFERVINPPSHSNPKTALESFMQPYELFPSTKVISLQEVLATVNRLTQFTDTLTHSQPKHTPKRLPTTLFLAAIMALGCNVGVRWMAPITQSVRKTV